MVKMILYCRQILVALLLAAAALPAGAQQLGDYLQSIGYRTTVWVDFNDIRKHDYGLFDPSVIGPGDFPGCYAVPNAPCIRAFNQRWGSPQGGGRLTAPWHRKGDLVGERFSQDTLQRFFDKVGLDGPPTELDREDAVLVAGAWDGLIAPSGAGLIQPPSAGSDPCAAWFLQFERWLSTASAPLASGENTCLAWAHDLETWLAQAPPPPPIACASETW